MMSEGFMERMVSVGSRKGWRGEVVEVLENDGLDVDHGVVKGPGELHPCSVWESGGRRCVQNCRKWSRQE